MTLWVQELPTLAATLTYMSGLERTLGDAGAIPNVGQGAFAHKGGLHSSAVQKDPRTYEHVPPETVGNARRILVSDQSGRSNLLVRLAREGHYDLLVLALPEERPTHTALPWSDWTEYVLNHAHCPVFLAAHPVIPKETVE